MFRNGIVVSALFGYWDVVMFGSHFTIPLADVWDVVTVLRVVEWLNQVFSRLD
jgi:hypothetical protein